MQTLLQKVEAALDGGATAVQYRDKRSSFAVRERAAAELANLCAGRALFIVNDDVQLAQRVRADGVHLGQSDGSVSQARARLGQEPWLGVSCRGEAALVGRAAEEGADYVAFGCCFPSATKPEASLLEREKLPDLCRLARQKGLSSVAIGGINEQNLPFLRRQGAKLPQGIAVCQALFGSEDVRLAAQRLAELFAKQDN